MANNRAAPGCSILLRCIVRCSIVACFLWLPILVGGCAKKAGHSAPSIIGTWKNLDRTKEKPVITFRDDGSYLLEFNNGKLKYMGMYVQSGSMMQVTDQYCGKAIKGEYQYTVTDNTLSFRMVSDSFCNRGTFFPERWVRVKNQK